MRLKGATYEEVSKAGGGINNTVTATRASSVEELVESAKPRVAAMLKEGVTTLEIKSGYGLELDAERRMLQAAAAIGLEFNVSTVKTFLGAHAVPTEFKGRTDAYITEVVAMLTPLHEEGLVDAVDCFMESIGFDGQQTAKVFDSAVAMGIPVRLHGDQLNDLGCGKFLSKYAKALSCDHCEYTSEASAKAMGAAGCVAVLLPTANYFIGETKMPPVSTFRKEGVRMAVATNCNPGSSPCVSILLAMNMAICRFCMAPEEALQGVTINAARALGLQGDRGSIELGKRADLAAWNVRHPCELAYYIGANPIVCTFVGGRERK
jgi:imidazolonepropionase